MRPLQHGIDSDPRNSRIGAGRRTDGFKSIKVFSHDETQQPTKICSKPVEEFARRENWAIRLKDLDQDQEAILEPDEPLSKFLKPPGQWAPVKFTSQYQPSTIGNKRRCPGHFESKLPEHRLKRRRSADCKNEGSSLDREVSIRRCRSSPPHNPIRSPSSPTLQATRPELACPYYKLDPSKYRSCLLTSLNTGPDVREHIERDHRRAAYCPRCYKEFSGKQATGDRRDHIRARECQLNQGPNIVEGLQGDLLDRLCEWEPVAGTHHPKEQWEEIWRIVFPEAPLPSTPFLDEQDKRVKVLRDVGRFWENEVSEGTMAGFERANKDGSLEALSVTADSGKLGAL